MGKIGETFLSWAVWRSIGPANIILNMSIQRGMDHDFALGASGHRAAMSARHTTVLAWTAGVTYDATGSVASLTSIGHREDDDAESRYIFIYSTYRSSRHPRTWVLVMRR